jgi:hypothetical protein
LTQHAIYKRRLSMVYVGNNHDISDIFSSLCGHTFLFKHHEHKKIPNLSGRVFSTAYKME